MINNVLRKKTKTNFYPPQVSGERLGKETNNELRKQKPNSNNNDEFHKI